MRGRGARRDYGWDDARLELEEGCHPEIVAARLGEPIDMVLKVADEQRWPIRWHGPTPDDIVDSFSKWIDA